MRILMTITGMLALFWITVIAMVWGIMAFTPTHSCDGSGTGVCTLGALPMKMMLFGPGVVLVGTSLATWIRATNGPRAAWPFIGIALVIGLFLTAQGIASS